MKYLQSHYFLFLQRHFAEVSTKFVKFQRPVDFDTKLTHVKRLLDDVDQRIHLVDIMSVNLDSADSKLEHCTVSNRNSSSTFSCPRRGQHMKVTVLSQHAFLMLIEHFYILTS